MDIIDLTSSPPTSSRKPKSGSNPAKNTLPVESLLQDFLSPTTSQGPPNQTQEENYGAFDRQYVPTRRWMNQTIYESSLLDKLHTDSYPKGIATSISTANHGIDNPDWKLHSNKWSKATQLSTSRSNEATAAHAPTKMKVKGKLATDFYVLSDYESTIGLDETFDLESAPTLKRRRLSPRHATGVCGRMTTSKSTDSARATTDVEAISFTTVAVTGNPSNMKTTKNYVLDYDPFALSSSPDVTRVARDKKGKQINEPTGYDDWENHGQLVKMPMKPYYKQRAPLEEISSDLELPSLGTVASLTSFPSMRNSSRGHANNALEAYNAEKPAQKKGKGKTNKDQDKSCLVEERMKAKEAEKERKRQDKERKAQEKQKVADIARVNTLRIDKKISTPEMIIDLPVDLESKLAEQLRQFLGPLGVECREWNSPVRNVFKWRRKVEAIYNKELEHWEPAPRQIKSEKHMMCVMGATQFVNLAIGEEGKDLDAHVITMKANFNECTIIYLIEGLTTWMRKNKNVKNRAFTQAVRDQMTQVELEIGSSSQKRKKKKTREYVDEDMVEDTLLRLQVIHGILIHHTAATIETAEWVTVFTQHISTIPYKHASLALNSSFCMAPGQVSTGINPSDTFLKMLQEINRITAPISYGIASEYGSATKLLEGFEAYGKDMLMNVKKSANKDGAVSDKTVGKSNSRRLYGIFMGTDDGSHDV